MMIDIGHRRNERFKPHKSDNNMIWGVEFFRD
jgi:hypothetical protein